MSEPPRLYLGLFTDLFDPTLLLWGNEAGLENLCELFLRLGSGDAARVQLCALPWVEALRGTSLSIEVPRPDAEPSLMRSDSAMFRWRLTPAQAAHFADLVAVIARSDRPCHHYLDWDESQDVIFVVSKGEYDGLAEQLAKTD